MRQIAQDIYLIEGGRGAHVYLLTSEEGVTLVDSGAPGGGDKIAAQLEEGGYALSDVRSIVVTHAHSDHTGALAELARRSGAQVLAHKDEVVYLERKSTLPYAGGLQRLIFGLTERVIFNFEPCIASTHPDQTRESAQELADLPVKMVLFGHGDPILEGAQEKMQAALV